MITPVGAPALAGIDMKLVVLLVDVLLIPQFTLPFVEEVIAVDTIVPQVIALVPQDIVPDDVNEEQVIEVNVAEAVDTIATRGMI